MEVRSFEPRDAYDVVQSWKDCGLVVPWNDPLNNTLIAQSSWKRCY